MLASLIVLWLEADNPFLTGRITEIQLALEGQLPIPKRAAAVQATAPPPVLKRSRAPLQPLSEFLKTSTSQPQPSEKEMKKSKPEGKDLMKSTMSINDEWEDKENHQMKKRKMKINDADEVSWRMMFVGDISTSEN